MWVNRLAGRLSSLATPSRIVTNPPAGELEVRLNLIGRDATGSRLVRVPVKMERAATSESLTAKFFIFILGSRID